MIGNDIVDLQLAKTQSNWRRKGWLQKLFTKEEQQYILSSTAPELQVWMLWSRKEAAYKAHQRRFCLQPRYIPKKIVCKEEIVTIEEAVYRTTTQCTQQYVYSVARVMDTHYNSEIYDTEIDIQTRFQQTMLKKSKEISLISFKKDINGIPFMMLNGVRSKIPFSLTHHGRFAAYVIQRQVL